MRFRAGLRQELREPVAWWDVRFGTVDLPRDRQPDRYGIEERIPAGWIGRLVYPFRRRAITSSPAAASVCGGDTRTGRRNGTRGSPSAPVG